jgi:hypothetical protein
LEVEDSREDAEADVEDADEDAVDVEDVEVE